MARRYLNGAGRAKADQFRFIHVSTDEVFGSLGEEGLFTETTAYDPSSPYSASKAGSDHLARAWHRTYGLPVIVSNCSNNYGPYQFPEKLIPLMILNALHAQPLPVYGDGGLRQAGWWMPQRSRSRCSGGRLAPDAGAMPDPPAFLAQSRTENPEQGRDGVGLAPARLGALCEHPGEVLQRVLDVGARGAGQMGRHADLQLADRFLDSSDPSARLVGPSAGPGEIERGPQQREHSVKYDIHVGPREYLVV